MTRSVVYGLALALVALLTGMGCYTMLRHPALTDSDEEISAESSDSTDLGDASCSSCHADPSGYHWSEQYYRRFYGYYHSPWTNYYARPWWRSDWHDQDARHGGSGSTHSTVTTPAQPAVAAPAQRNAWERGSAPFIPSVSGTAPSSPTVETPQPTTKEEPSPPDTASKPAPPPPSEPETNRNAWRR